MKLAAHIPQLVADMKVVVAQDHNTSLLYGMNMVSDELFKAQVLGVLALRNLDDDKLVSDTGYTGPRFLPQDRTLYAWMDHGDFPEKDVHELLQAVHDELCEHFEAVMRTPEGTAKMEAAMRKITRKG